MKKIIDTLKNIFSIEDLRNRIFLTLAFIFIYRIGCFVVLPGINPESLANLGEDSSKGILGVFNLFAGGAFSQASVFALGIMPYISTSIVIQLLTLAVPYFQKLQKEGESGRKKITQYTRIGTVLVALLQASAYVQYLKGTAKGGILVDNQFLFWLSTTIILTAGTIFVMWLGEQIQERGLGNGTSLIIMSNIISRLPGSFWTEATFRTKTGGGILMLILEMAILTLIIIGTIALIQAVRKVPVNYAKRIVGGQAAGGVRQFIPLKVNIAGVMPIIFAQAFLFVPGLLSRLAPDSQFLQKFNDFTSLPYNALTFLLVVTFTYFYTALIMNPTQMSDDLKRNNGFVPGVKPGPNTAEFIDTVISRITLPGAIALGLIAILPAFAKMLGINSQFAVFFGGTSLLILVGVVLDTMQQIESHLLNRHYDGLTQSGSRIRGRNLTNTEI